MFTTTIYTCKNEDDTTSLEQAEAGNRHLAGILLCHTLIIFKRESDTYAIDAFSCFIVPPNTVDWH